jgi:hypothetical protein
MNVKTKLYLGAALALVGVGVYLDRKYTAAGGASGIAFNVADTLWNNAAGAAVDWSGKVWDTAQTPQTNLGPANGLGTGIVNAPSNVLNAASLGLIGGANGNKASGIGDWLMSIVDGSYFAPKATTNQQ